MRKYLQGKKNVSNTLVFSSYLMKNNRQCVKNVAVLNIPARHKKNWHCNSWKQSMMILKFKPKSMEIMDCNSLAIIDKYKENLNRFYKKQNIPDNYK